MEKAYRNLDTTLKTSMKGLSDGSIVGDKFWETNIEKYVEKFRDIQDYMQDTGLMPKNMNSGLYSAYANVVKIYEEYLQVNKSAEKLLADSETQTEEYTEWKANLNDITTLWTGLNEKANTYKEKLDNAKQAQPLKDALGSNADNMIKRYVTMQKNIEEITDRIQKLREEADRSMDMVNTPGRSAESQKTLLESVAQLESQINMLETNRANIQRGLNTLGKANISIIQQILAITQGDVHSVEELEQKWRDATEEAKRAKKELDVQRGQEPEQFTYDYEGYEKALNHAYDLKNALIAAAQKTDELQQKADNVGHSFNQVRMIAFAFYRVLGAVNTVNSDIVRLVRRIANLYNKLWSIIKKVLSAINGYTSYIPIFVNFNFFNFVFVLAWFYGR